MKVTTIADAMKCASKVNQGKHCSMAEMKATIKLLERGLRTARQTARILRDQRDDSKDMVRALMAKIGL